jgi:hypothetical protein
VHLQAGGSVAGSEQPPSKLANTSAKAKGARRGKRGSHGRRGSVVGEEEEAKGGPDDAEKESEGAQAAPPPLVLDPKDLVVSTEQMRGALEALLPG